MIRTFVALDPSPPVRQRLIGVRRELEACGADIRWARDEGLHCTLKFLGGMPPEKLEQVTDALRAALPRRPRFELAARGVGAFPTWKRARLVWAGVVDRDAAATALAAAVEDALAPLGFAPEARAFRPHITLGRVRSRNGLARLGERIDALAGVDFGAWQVDGAVVYRSDLQRGGSRYTPLATIELGE